MACPSLPAFTITTDTCNEYTHNGGNFPDGLMDEIKAALADVEAKTGKKSWAMPKNPLLVSVRSGAKFSMPGMMDTVLNLGLNDATVEGLIKLTGNERFVYDLVPALPNDALGRGLFGRPRNHLAKHGLRASLL